MTSWRWLELIFVYISIFLILMLCRGVEISMPFENHQIKSKQSLQYFRQTMCIILIVELVSRSSDVYAFVVEGRWNGSGSPEKKRTFSAIFRYGYFGKQCRNRCSEHTEMKSLYVPYLSLGCFRKKMSPFFPVSIIILLWLRQTAQRSVSRLVH